MKKPKFIRWLGAFDKKSSLMESAQWEVVQTERQIAAEPIVNGESLISHAQIGLVVDAEKSRFHAGWVTDAWTENKEGLLKAKYKPSARQGKKFRNPDRLLAAITAYRKTQQDWFFHAEAVFDCPIYSAVVYKDDSVKELAEKVGNYINLPVIKF